MSENQAEPNATPTPTAVLPVAPEDALELKRLKSDIVITRHVAVAAGAGFIPLPLIDFAAITTVQLTMLYQICNIYSVPFSKEAARSVIASLVGAAIPGAESRSMAFSSALKAIPLIGTLAALIITPAIAGATTYAVGKVFVQHIETGGTLLTFNARRMRRHFEKALEHGKKIVPGSSDTNTNTAEATA